MFYWKTWSYKKKANEMEKNKDYIKKQELRIK